MQNKKESDVLGSKILCSNFSKCPLCFGCRNYSTLMAECEECGKDKKTNVCNTSIHVTKSVSMMITKNKIELK